MNEIIFDPKNMETEYYQGDSWDWAIQEEKCFGVNPGTEITYRPSKQANEIRMYEGTKCSRFDFGIWYPQTEIFSSKINDAYKFAEKKHENQLRKGKNIPYFSHPKRVAEILTSNGCSEKVIIAGLLHDTLEDTDTTKEEIGKLFGEDILLIVEAESEDKTRTWKERKQTTIDNLPNVSFEAKLVCCADKLANLKEMAFDKQFDGEKLWEKFNAPLPKKENIQWYYQGIWYAMPDLKSYIMYQDMEWFLNNIVFENTSHDPCLRSVIPYALIGPQHKYE